MSQSTSEPIVYYDKTRVIERADGFYWLDKQTDDKFGPFASLLEAIADMESNVNYDADLEPGESLKEAEEELGIADWIDPDTGDPAEESVPHIEEH